MRKLIWDNVTTKFLGNPFYCYIFSFGLSLIIYSWEWSDIYPPLSISVTFFLLITFLSAFILGKRVQYKLSYRSTPLDSRNGFITSVILSSYVLEFIHNKGIPLFDLLLGKDISYMEFGIPTFHVLLHTLTNFYCVYIFYQYLSNRQHSLLIIFLLLISPNLLIVNRGATIMTLTACFIIYFIYIQKVNFKKILILFVCLSVFFYGFGYLGNVRSFNGDPMAFPTITKAKDHFIDSRIPKEFYWFYIYASSPFANFQNVTIVDSVHSYNFSSFIVWEILPDFISKRIIPIESDIEMRNRLDYSVNPILTVGSVYYDAFIRMGWYGPILIFIFYSTLVYFYIMLLTKDNKYFIPALSILCVISIFNIFENMINFSGLSFQLIYPLIFSKVEKYKFLFDVPNFKKFRLKFVNTKIKFRI